MLNNTRYTSIIGISIITSALIAILLSVGCSDEMPQYNFTYREGEKPRRNHIPSEKDIPFKDYKITTNAPIESEHYLPIWERALKATNGMSDMYFNRHIRVIRTSAEKYGSGENTTQKFRIHYYYYIDWAQVKLRDSFTIGYGESQLYDNFSCEAIDDSLSAFEERMMDERSGKHKHIQKIEIIDSIASKEEIIAAVSEASPHFFFDVGKHFRFDHRGQLTLRLQGEVDASKNKCIRGKIAIKDARILEISGSPCFIY